MIYRATVNVYKDIDKTDLIFSTAISQAMVDPDQWIDTRKSIAMMFQTAWENIPCFIDKVYIYYEWTDVTEEVTLDTLLWEITEDDEWCFTIPATWNCRWGAPRDVYFTYDYTNAQYDIKKVIQNWITYNFKDSRLDWIEQLL